MISLNRCFPFTLVCAGLFFAADTGVAADKPVLLYSRYFNAQGENRYEPEGVYSEVMRRLREHFEVRINRQPISRDNLRGVRLVLVVNPSDKAAGTNAAPPHVTARDVENIADYVRAGGGLIVMENQENHNLEVEAMNRLLGRFGIQATNLYTDAKKLVIPKSAPLAGGLRWAYYTGNLLRVDDAHPAHPRAWIVNDLEQKPAKGPRDQTGVLAAIAEPGQGRVAVVTDSGWITNWAFSEEGIGGVAIKGQDNWEIFRRLCDWVAHRAEE